MKRTLKVGIVGVGMGRNHIPGFQKHPGSTVVALADPNAARMKEVGDKAGVNHHYPSLDAMLNAEKLDIVSIATPNFLHAPLTIQALEAGCHVACEKPMAMNAQEAEEMLAVARRVNRRIMINFSYRFTDASRALRLVVDKGTLGDIYYGRTMWLRRRGMPGFGGWFGQKAKSGGGPLIDLGVHRLDLALWLMGYPKPTWVMGSTYNHLASEAAAAEGKAFDVEDLAAGMIKFENGATLDLAASWAGHIQEAELMETRLLGTRGGLVQRNRNGKYEFEA
ncbi:MAG: Gfo/Idh/MocA family oxidoreductase, partial [Verrucomicrobia bacterium]|nr:Gfo/Idh/MocA family oxidoreductase [Verrucomicrobiota bacterium]